MIVFSNPEQVEHAPRDEFYRGERVRCLESPARVQIVCDTLRARGHAVRKPTHDAGLPLARVHSARYLSFLESAWAQWLSLDADNAGCQPFPSVWPIRAMRTDVEPMNFTARLGRYSMDNGSPISAGTWLAARSAADAVVSAAAVVRAGARSAFCATRPPGHHAGGDYMGGYCFLNNAAIAAEALRADGCERIAILDVDFHHGNGTQDVFYHRADVLFVSIHGDPRTEYPFYLGHADEAGADAGLGFNLNLPLPSGSGASAWFAALDSACARIVAYQPAALVVSLGLDTFVGDPIAGFGLHTTDYIILGRRLAQLNLPSLFVLEGGYATRELGENAANVVDGFEQAVVA